ncbi:hypothetical protein [Providencia sp.]|nr:hypothetical protein [Providencia sp.]
MTKFGESKLMSGKDIKRICEQNNISQSFFLDIEYDERKRIKMGARRN